MANLTLKGVPEGLLAELKREAVDHRRSLNGEVIYRLEQSVSVRSTQSSPGGTPYPGRPASAPTAVKEPKDLDAAEWLERVRALRERINVRTTVDEIISARDEGRR